MSAAFSIRLAQPKEYQAIGQLMVQVYSSLEGFPQPDEHPTYYHKLAHVGELAQKDGIDLLVAVNEDGAIGGAVVYFHDITLYGARGVADHEENAGAFRLLAVDPATRGQGLGRQLIQACLNTAKETGKSQVVIHSTQAMQVAWGMYERLGFVRAQSLDFDQNGFPIFGFRLTL